MRTTYFKKIIFSENGFTPDSLEDMTKTELIIFICTANPRWKKYQGRLFAKNKENLFKLAEKYLRKNNNESL